MAVAKTTTLLSLDRFFQVIGMNPYHANGVAIPDINGSGGILPCGSPILQYDWQRSDATSRESIAMAIYDAEQLLAEHLGFNVMPRYEVDDISYVTRLAMPELIAESFTGSVKANRGYVISGGIEAKEYQVPVGAQGTVTYSDPDGDGFKELATITISTAATDPAEIAIYYPGHNGDDAWEIRPINVSIVLGNAIITLPSWQLVKESIFESISANRAIDGSNVTNFLAGVEVYRHYLDPQQQVQFMWLPNGGSCSCGGTCVCEYSSQYGCMYIKDYRQGLFGAGPADWVTADSAFSYAGWSVGRAPDRVRMWYRAGWRDTKLALPNIQMDHQWEFAVARLALSLLDRPLCECENLKNTVSYWGEDLSLRSGTSQMSSSYALSRQQIDNPLGRTRAAFYAWSLIERYRLGEGYVG